MTVLTPSGTTAIPEAEPSLDLSISKFQIPMLSLTGHSSGLYKPYSVALSGRKQP
jgi:hypothetical protein